MSLLDKLMAMRMLKHKGFCPICKKSTKRARFKDELSKKEFGITGICQKCQDKFEQGGEE